MLKFANDREVRPRPGLNMRKNSYQNTRYIAEVRSTVTSQSLVSLSYIIECRIVGIRTAYPYTAHANYFGCGISSAANSPSSLPR